MVPVVDVQLERLFRGEDPEGYAAWWTWLGEVLGADPAELDIIEITLGEGHIEVRRWRRPFVVIGDTLDTFVESYPAPKPPPAWPVAFGEHPMP